MSQTHSTKTLRAAARPARFASLLGLTFAATLLPGCVVWDIKDGIETSNANLQTINDSFAMVEATNERLDRIDANLRDTEQRIATLQITLDSIEVSLASLRKTINNIDSTIPFLSFSGDDDEEKEALEAGNDPSDQADPAAPTDSETPANIDVTDPAEEVLLDNPEQGETPPGA